MATVLVEGTRGGNTYNPPAEGKFTIRGKYKGAKAKKGKCEDCGDHIEIGEQYIRVGGEHGESLCLGCALY